MNSNNNGNKNTVYSHHGKRHRHASAQKNRNSVSNDKSKKKYLTDHNCTYNNIPYVSQPIQDSIHSNGVNHINQQFMRMQIDITNMLVTQIGYLMTQNNIMCNTVQSIRNELDNIKIPKKDKFDFFFKSTQIPSHPIGLPCDNNKNTSPAGFSLSASPSITEKPISITSKNENKTDVSPQNPIRVQDSRQEISPHMTMVEIIKMAGISLRETERYVSGSKCREADNNVFKEIQLPDMQRELYKSYDMTEYPNFEQFDFYNLDDIGKQGQIFLDAIDDHNKKCDHLTKTNLEKQKKLSKIINQSIDSQIIDSQIIDSQIIDSKIIDSNINKDMHNSRGLDVNSVSVPTNFDEKNPIKITTNTEPLDILDNSVYRNCESKKMCMNTKILKDENNLYSFMGKRYSIDPRKLMHLVKPIKLLNSMIGMSEVKDEMFKFVSNFLHNSRNNGMLNTAIYGKPGIGKTDLGKILCMIYIALELVPSTKFKLVKASEFIGQYVGQTRQNTKRIIDEANGGVLFIDEAYALTGGSDKKGITYGKECIDTLNQELSENRHKLIVIVAGYENEIKECFFNINQGLERRFPFRYCLKDYTKEDMKDIFIRMIRLNKNMYLYKDIDNMSYPIDNNNNIAHVNPEKIDNGFVKSKKINRHSKNKNLVGTVTEKDIVDMFDDMRYFNNCGGDIENLITHIGFANSKRTVGKQIMLKNIFSKEDMHNGLIAFKKHKAQFEDESWKKMFI